jgi:hypothetical protein
MKVSTLAGKSLRLRTVAALFTFRKRCGVRNGSEMEQEIGGPNGELVITASRMAARGCFGRAAERSGYAGTSVAIALSPALALIYLISV